MSVFSVLFDAIGQLFNFSTPIGLTFGAVVVGAFGAPLVVRAVRKFF